MARLISMLSVCCVALAAAMMAGGAGAAGQQTTWLADLLQGSSTAGRPDVAAAAQHYAESVLEKFVSLPILSGDGCDTIDDTNQYIFSQTLGCPAKEKPYSAHSGSFSTSFASSAGVASCTFQAAFSSSFSIINELAPGVGVVGTVSFICHFNGGADKCESPLCAGMTITGFARILQIANNDANTKLFLTRWGSYPPGTANGGDVFNCQPIVRRAGRKTGAPGQAKKKAHAQAVQTASYSYYDDEAAALYYPAGAGAYVDVLLGTFTVVSARSPTKFTGGTIQSVAVYGQDDTPPTPVTTLPTGAYAFTPWTVDLAFTGKEY